MTGKKQIKQIGNPEFHQPVSAQVGRLRKRPGDSLERGKYLILCKGEVRDLRAGAAALNPSNYVKTGSPPTVPEVHLRFSCLARQPISPEL